MYARQVFREILQVVADLQTQFARRTQNQRLRLSVVDVERLQERNAEGRRLARTRLCEGDEVAFFCVQQIRNHLFLHRHGLFEAQLADGASNLFAYAKFFKCFQLEKEL